MIWVWSALSRYQAALPDTTLSLGMFWNRKLLQSSWSSRASNTTFCIQFYSTDLAWDYLSLAVIAAASRHGRPSVRLKPCKYNRPLDGVYFSINYSLAMLKTEIKDYSAVCTRLQCVVVKWYA